MNYYEEENNCGDYIDCDNYEDLYSWFEQFVQREANKSCEENPYVELAQRTAESFRESVLSGGREDMAGTNQGFWRVG